MTHTLQGGRLLERFVRELCDCEALWTPSNIISDAIDTIREQVGTDEVILGLSGGVDSSVVAALLHKAIGDQLTCVFVDNGLLRHQEGDQVMEMFADNMGVKVIGWTRKTTSSANWPARRIRAQAQDHRQHLYRYLR